MTRINHDQLFKELLTVFFVEFLELFFPVVLEYLDTETITFLDKELFINTVQGEKKIMDIVASAKFQQQDYSFLIHIENESKSNTDFNERLFRYFCTLFLRYNRPVYPIVVFSYDKPKRLDKSSFVIDFPDKQVLNFDYEIVQLNSLDWRNFINQKNPVAAALMAKMDINVEDRPKVKAECLRLLVTLELDPAKMELISGFVALSNNWRSRTFHYQNSDRTFSQCLKLTWYFYTELSCPIFSTANRFLRFASRSESDARRASITCPVARIFWMSRFCPYVPQEISFRI